MKRILAWHFINGDTLRDGQKAVVGKTYTVKPPLKMCERGLHASIRAIDALQYSPGNTVCRVACWGDVEQQNDKLVCSNRKILAMADADVLLHHFASDCALTALCIADFWDERSMSAIEAVYAYPNISADARDAARDAAWGAALGAALAADCAALDAALAADCAARDAASYAALDAASYAALDADCAAARDDQNEILENALLALIGLDGK